MRAVQGAVNKISIEEKHLVHLHTKNTYIVKLYLNIVTIGIEALVFRE
jgi:hypothetical protein